MYNNLDTSSPMPTGIPEKMKVWAEKLSGCSLDSAEVYYNSTEPSKYGVKSYTEGNKVYISPGNDSRLFFEIANLARNQRGGKLMKPSFRFATSPIQCWNFNAHLQSMNAAMDKADAYNRAAGRAPFEEKVKLDMCSGNLMNDLGENEVSNLHKSSLFDSGGFGIKYTLAKYVSFKPTKDSKFIASSHTGALQYLHSMRGTGVVAAGYVKAAEYVKFAYRVAKDTNITNLKAKDATTLNALKEDAYYRAFAPIIDDFIEVFGGGAYLSTAVQVGWSGDKVPGRVRAYFLGSAAHVIQDSFCNSHTLRRNYRAEKCNAALDLGNCFALINGEGEGSAENNMDTLMNMLHVTDIISFRDYVQQDEHRHEVADRMVEGSIIDTPGLQQATHIISIMLAALNKPELEAASLDAFFDRVFRKADTTGTPLPTCGRAYRKIEIPKVLMESFVDYIDRLDGDELNHAKLYRATPSRDNTQDAPYIITSDDRQEILNLQNTTIAALIRKLGSLSVENIQSLKGVDAQKIAELINTLREDMNEIRFERPAPDDDEGDT